MPHFYHIATLVWSRSFRYVLDQEDAVQEGVMECWRRRDEYDPSRGAPSTFFRVAWSAMTAFVMWHRRKKRNIPALQMSEEFDYPSSGLDASEQLIYREELEEVPRRMRRITSRERSVIRRRFWTGETLAEIGDDLGVTSERVRQIQNNALEKMGRTA